MLKVIRGEDKVFEATFRKEACEGEIGDPLDLTTVTEIVFTFPGETVAQSISLTGTEITVLNATLGKVQGNISAAKTALLKVGESQTFEAKITDGGKIKKVKFLEQLTVESSLG